MPKDRRIITSIENRANKKTNAPLLSIEKGANKKTNVLLQDKCITISIENRVDRKIDIPLQVETANIPSF